MTELTATKLLSLPKKEAEKEFNRLSITSQAMMTLLAPWEKRQELMILSENFPELVRSMPVEELFWTVKSTGPEDSLPIISAATFDQLQFIFDLDWWDKDSLRIDRATAWLVILFEAGEETMNRWLLTLHRKDPYLVPALMRHFIEVQKRPDDMEIEEAKDLLHPFTIDNIYYVKFTNDKLATMWERMLMKLLELSDGLYRDCMETILTETRTECVEEAWKLRCGRLADFGIPDYFSALDIYAPVQPEAIRNAAPVALDHRQDEQEMPAFVPTLYISEFPALSTALSELAETPHISRIIREWTGAANKIMMADRIDLDDPDTMRKALKKAASLITLGIETTEAFQPGRSFREILATHVIEDLIRAAVWRLSDIRRRARTIARDVDIKLLPSQYAERFRALAMLLPMRWDEKLMEPVPFSSTEEVEGEEKLLEEIEAWYSIMKHLSPHWQRWREAIAWETTNFLSWAEFTWQQGLATAIANFILDDAAVIVPVPESELPRLRDALKDNAWGKMAENISADFSSISGISKEMAGQILEEAAGPMRDELLAIKDENGLKGQYIASILVERV